MAVKALRAGGSSISTILPSSRYEGRKVSPHSDTQCASSIAIWLGRISFRKEDKRGCYQAFRIRDHYLGLALLDGRFGLRPLLRTLTSAEKRATQPGRLQSASLILHQGEEGINDYGGAGKEEGGQLETERLAEAGGKEDDLAKGFRPGRGGIDDIGRDQALVGVEVVQAEAILEGVGRDRPEVHPLATRGPRVRMGPACSEVRNP